MNEMLKRLLKSKIVAAVCLVVILTIVLCAYFFQQSLETYLAWGLLGLFVGCFLSNATILLPAPSLLLVCQFSLIYNPFWVAFVGSIGTTLGELVGYIAGASGQELLQPQKSSRLLNAFRKHPYLIVFIFSCIPWPVFDFVGIISGATHIKIKCFMFSCWLGKLLKMLVIGMVTAYLVTLYPDFFNDISWATVKELF